jgi:hypothetical protein
VLSTPPFAAPLVGAARQMCADRFTARASAEAFHMAITSL